jgi:hypothetical protein
MLAVSELAQWMILILQLLLMLRDARKVRLYVLESHHLKKKRSYLGDSTVSAYVMRDIIIRTK